MISLFDRVGNTVGKRRKCWLTLCKTKKELPLPKLKAFAEDKFQCGLTLYQTTKSLTIPH